MLALNKVKLNSPFLIRILTFYLLKIKKELDEHYQNATHIKLARDFEEYKKAYSLVYKRYYQKGLVKESKEEFLRKELNYKKTVLYAENNGQVIATLTPIFSEEQELPSIKVYESVIDDLMKKGRKIVEFSRLACTLNIPILMRLFRTAFKLSMYRGYNDIIIEVHPKHGFFYEKFFLFEKIGGYVNLPHLNGAPAILYRLDLDTIKERLYKKFAHNKYGINYCNFFFKDKLPEDILLE